MNSLLSKTTDAELVEAACSGDVDSFSELYRRHYAMAVGVARSRLECPHLAEDVAQESFAIACRSLSTLRNAERFPEWLGTLCRRTASRIAEENQRHDKLHMRQHPSDSARILKLKERVHQALAELDDDSRELVMLHYLSRMTYQEIAAATGLTPAAVHGRLQRARRRLSDTLHVTEHPK